MACLALFKTTCMTESHNIEKGQWYRLSTGNVVEVCCISKVEVPATFRHEVTLRYLNADGAMSPNDFQVSLEFMKARSERVRVAPPVVA